MTVNGGMNCATCGAPRSVPGPHCPACLLGLGIETNEPKSDATPVIDDFQILRTLGEGGMGTVYLADQLAPLRRRVALKVVRHGSDTREVLTRFGAERQALALMDHPSIAKVFDAGALPSGEPYFSMEFIDGPRLTDYADDKVLTTRERLELFATLCDGVQHAHQKGIIHRDLKPSNVLVAESDGEVVPKIIDFGIAKATERRLTDETILTGLGVVVGTPLYMSPEQAGLSPLGVDTRSDIYSLGVMLYELLCGTLPFDAAGVGVDEVRRRVREDDPQTPSARVSATDAEVKAIAQRRRADPSTLRRQLRGDLDWITMKALERDVRRRYQTAAALASDIRAHLADEPVSARAPSAIDRARKFTRRHRVGVAVAGTAFLGVSVFAGAMWRQSLEIAAQRDRAELERASAERVAGFLSSLLGRMNPEEIGIALWHDLAAQAAEVHRARGADDDELARARSESGRALAGVNATEVARRLLDRDLLRVAGVTVGAELADDSRSAARLRLTLGETYRQLGLYLQAEPQIAHALEIRTRLFGRADLATIEAVSALGCLHRDAGRFDESEALLRESLDALRTHLGEDHLESLRGMHELGDLLHRRGRYEEALALHRKVLDPRRRLLGAGHPDTLASLHALGALLEDMGNLEQAEALLREAVTGAHEVHGEDDRRTLEALNTLGVILDARGKSEEAEATYRELLSRMRRTLGDEHPDTLAAITNLGALLRNHGRLKEAEQLYREALAGKRLVLGNEHPSTLTSLNNLGALLRSFDRLAEAEAVFRECAELRARVIGPDHRDTLGALSNLGEILARQNQLDAAERILEDVADRYRSALGGDHRDTLIAVTRLAELREAQGRQRDARALHLEALDGYRRVLGETHPLTINAHNSIGWLHQSRGESAAAEACFREVLRLRRASEPEGHAWIGIAQTTLSRTLIERGRFGEAESLLREAVEIARRTARDGDWYLAESQSLLGRALTGLGRMEEAESVLLEASASGTLKGGRRLDRRRELFDALVALYERWGRPDRAAEWRARLLGS